MPGRRLGGEGRPSHAMLRCHSNRMQARTEAGFGGWRTGAAWDTPQSQQVGLLEFDRVLHRGRRGPEMADPRPTLGLGDAGSNSLRE